MAVMQDSVIKYFSEIKNGCNNLVDCQNLFNSIEEKEDLFLLDIRKKEDFAKNHIEGSIHCDWSEVFDFIEEDILPMDQKIIVICYSGQTAGQVVGVLKTLGYDACALKGGMINGWMKSAMPVEAACST